MVSVLWHATRVAAGARIEADLVISALPALAGAESHFREDRVAHIIDPPLAASDANLVPAQIINEQREMEDLDEQADQ